MAGTPPPTPPPHDGLAAAALRGFGSLLRHLQALGALAQFEAREASLQYLKVFVYAILAVLFLAFGYVSFLLFVSFLLGGLFGISWLWITLGLTLLHLALLLVCAWQIRHGIQRPVFTATAEEFRRDARALGAAPATSSSDPRP